MLTVVGRWLLSREAPQGLALLLSGAEHPLREGDKATLLTRPQEYLSMAQRAVVQGAPSQPELTPPGRGAWARAAAWLFSLTSQATRVKLLHLSDLRPFTDKTGIILALLRDVVRFD